MPFMSSISVSECQLRELIFTVLVFIKELFNNGATTTYITNIVYDIVGKGSFSISITPTLISLATIPCVNQIGMTESSVVSQSYNLATLRKLHQIYLEVLSLQPKMGSDIFSNQPPKETDVESGELLTTESQFGNSPTESKINESNESGTTPKIYNVDKELISKIKHLRTAMSALKLESGFSWRRYLHRFSAICTLAISGAPLFSGSMLDILGALVIGIVCAFFFSVGEMSKSFGSFQLLLSSYICGLAGIFLTENFPQLSYWPIILGGTLWNLPGFSLLIGTLEIINFDPSKGLVGLSILFKAISNGITMAMGFSFANFCFKKISGLKTLSIKQAADELEQVDKLYISIFSGILLASGSTLLMEGSFAQIVISSILTFICIAVLFSCTTNGISDLAANFVASFCVGYVSLFMGYFFEDSHLSYLYIAFLPIVPGGMYVKAMYNLIENFIDSFLEHDSLIQKTPEKSFLDSTGVLGKALSDEHNQSPILATNVVSTSAEQLYQSLLSVILYLFVVAYGIAISESLFFIPKN